MQLTAPYWEEFGGWTNLGYSVPPGCSLSTECPPFEDHYGYNYTITHCQICDETEGGRPWNYYEWILTSSPHVFGLMPGWANPTGVALICILTVMVICSLPYVRRGGYFEVFYFSHLLYTAYWILLILHAPEFWKWLIAPRIIFILELLYRVLTSILGKGRTHIQAGVVLPSKVSLHYSNIC